MIRKFMCFFVASVCISNTFAEVYKWDTDKGKRHYGDAPAVVTGTEIVKLPPPPSKDAVDSATKVANDAIRDAKAIEAAEKEAIAKQHKEVATQAQKAVADKNARDSATRAKKSQTGFKDTEPMR